MLSSCQEFKPKYSLDAVVYENQDNDKYGLMGPDGNQLGDFEESPTCAINGFFAIENDSGDLKLCRIEDKTYSIIDGTEVYNSVGVMNDGLIPVCEDGQHIKVLDEDGQFVFLLDSVNGVEVSGCYSYSCAIMRVILSDGTYVFLDRQGKMLFNRSYEWCSDFENGYAVVCIEDDSYACINTKGENIFTFTCDDSDYIIFSPRHQKLATRDEDEQIIIYDFDGRQVNKYPKKVEEIYALGENSFVFANDDEEYGLMEYSGRELIWAKYDQLVPSGDYFLAIHPDDDEIVKLIDENDNTLNTFDGEEIYDFQHLGYDFPNAVVRPDEELYLIDQNGKIIGDGAKNYEIDLDDVEEAHQLSNLYYPRERVMSTVMQLCGNGSGIPVGQGAFFFKDGNFCHTYEVDFIKNYSNVNFFTGKKDVYVNIDQGVNYEIDFWVFFDEPIVRKGSNDLNRSAWLIEMRIRVEIQQWFYRWTFMSQCVQELAQKGCTVLYSDNDGNYIISSNNGENLFILTQMEIIIRRNSEGVYQQWVNELKNSKK